MRLIRALAPTAAVAGLVLLGACGSSTDTTSTPAASSPAASSTGEVTELRTATTAIGTIVTDGRGMTLYMFDKDTQGASASACTGDCLAAWPPALAGASMPTASGVTGAVATIATPEGGKQLTLDGWPLYYFAQDAKAGDTTGQAVGGVWWALSPSGAPIKGDGGSGGY